MPEQTEQPPEQELTDQPLEPNISFTVSARTARLIGQENFANAEGAVIELVKNSYDADATICLVIIDASDDRIFIYDSGEGMSDTQIEKHWMTIGTDDKKNNIKSTAKRVRTGAKGIGRFALDRLGTRCKMITKRENEPAFYWEVDWKQFEMENAVISDIKAHLHELPEIKIVDQVKAILESFELDTTCTSFWKEDRGTLLEISGLRDQWDDGAIDSLFNNLQILVPPIETNLFSVFLYDASLPAAHGQVASAHYDDYDYKVKATVKENRDVEITIYRNELNIAELKRSGFFKKTKLTQPNYREDVFETGSYTIDTNLEALLAGFKDIDAKGNINRVGPFDFTFYFLKRGGGQEKDEDITKYPYKNVTYINRTSWLDKFGGIKIFRDHFRVRPYGEPKSSSFDWLDLGKRALSNPTVTRPGYKVRPQQIYGVVNISRVDNIAFEDKSSREGLQENDVFTLFKEILRAIIEKFENDRNQIMMSLKKIYDENNVKRKAKLEADNIVKSEKSTFSSTEKQTLQNAIEAYKEEINDLKEEQKLLRVLASAGLVVTSFAHEFHNLAENILPRTDDLRDILLQLIDKDTADAMDEELNPFIMIEDIKTVDTRLKAWLDFSLLSVRKDKRKRKIIEVVDYIESMERVWRAMLARRRVNLSINKGNILSVRFNGYEIDLDSIFNNLMSNSIDAFKRPDAGDQRDINISFTFNPLDAKGISVIYEDSGPGLSEEITDPNEIFQPYFTTKRDKRTGEKIGFGLGMWIVKSVIEEYNGDIEILRTTPGVKFKISLPHN